VYRECSARATSRGRCPAMVVERDGEFQRGRNQHTHEAVAGLGAPVALAADVRKTARDDLYSSASLIVATAMTRVDVVRTIDRRPNLNSVLRTLTCMMDRKRKCYRRRGTESDTRNCAHKPLACYYEL